jgi:membrane-bound ClpP family serine protease
MVRTSPTERVQIGADAVRLAMVVCAAATLWLTAVTARAEEQDAAPSPAAATEKSAGTISDDQSNEGRLIRIQLPLTNDADSHVKSTIKRVIDQIRRKPQRDSWPRIVLELSPRRDDGTAGAGTDFTRALSVANYLTGSDLSGIKTVAYVPRTIKGHGVLIALACDQIVMDPDAELGEATIDEDSSRATDSKIVSSYKAVADAKRGVPIAIVMSMVDRRAEALKVETDQGFEYVLRTDLEALKKQHTVISEKSLVTPGSLGSFSGSQGREFGVVLASDTDSLARGIGVRADSLKQDQATLMNWAPVIIRLEGPITRHKIHQFRTLLGTELKNQRANWFCIQINSEGGNLEDCKDLAAVIAKLNADEAQTVAYVPVNASGGAALVALACNKLIMQPEAHIGGKGSLELDRKTLDSARDPIRESLARDPDRTWSLIAATIDPQIDLFTYHNAKTGDDRYFSDEEARKQINAADWQRGARVKPVGETLRLNAKRAAELGIATHVVDTFDELKQLYGFDGDIRVAEPNWALELVEALASPALSVLLLVVAFVGVYVELHSPGTGIGGFVAAVAFLLFFWSHYLEGTAEWLEVLLFLGGIFCVLLEVLVLPGFGIFGLGGGTMILVSLILATQTFVLPRTESQMIELRHSLTIVAAASLIVVATSIALRQYLPSTPIFKKLLLDPPPEEELIDLAYREALVDFSHLVGEHGVTTTNLMPAGKAEFNGQLVDVIAEGLPIDRGTMVTVVKVQGNRVLVHAVEV